MREADNGPIPADTRTSRFLPGVLSGTKNTSKRLKQTESRADVPGFFHISAARKCADCVALGPVTLFRDRISFSLLTSESIVRLNICANKSCF